MQRAEILRQVRFSSLGWQMAEFCQMRRYTAASASGFVSDTKVSSITCACEATKRKGRSDRYGASGRVGAFELLPLADGVSDVAGDSAAGQCTGGRAGERASAVAAWEQA